MSRPGTKVLRRHLKEICHLPRADDCYTACYVMLRPHGIHRHSNRNLRPLSKWYLAGRDPCIPRDPHGPRDCRRYIYADGLSRTIERGPMACEFRTRHNHPFQADEQPWQGVDLPAGGLGRPKSRHPGKELRPEQALKLLRPWPAWHWPLGGSSPFASVEAM